ncbi:MAG: galactokinase family protein [Thermofilaceae archaeon]
MRGKFATPRSKLEVLDEIRRTFGKPIRAASAPGRADFLNTHQDYKGLPVVPVAVNLRTYAVAIEELPDRFEVISLNMKREGRAHTESFALNPKLEGKGVFGDYLRACVLALRGNGFSIKSGLKIVIDSDVPVGAGLGSSAALEVAFIKLLDTHYGLKLGKDQLAELAFKAENEIMRIPCGRLDQYGSSYGGAILLYTKLPVQVEELPLSNVNFAIADSGIKHRVASIHPVRQAEIELGLSQLLELDDLPVKIKRLLGRKYWEPKWEELRLEELNPYLNEIDEKAAKRIRFTLLMHRLTLLALKLIKTRSLTLSELEEIGSKVDATFLEILGAIIDKQHELLRDLYEVSLPELENIREAMLNAGAYGAKISGAGLGGALIALVDEQTGRKVAEEAVNAGAYRSFLARVDEGAREEGLW